MMHVLSSLDPLAATNFELGDLEHLDIRKVIVEETEWTEEYNYKAMQRTLGWPTNSKGVEKALRKVLRKILRRRERREDDQRAAAERPSCPHEPLPDSTWLFCPWACGKKR